MKENDLGKKLGNLAKNSWKLIPIVGFVQYNNRGFEKDSGFKASCKMLAHVLWGVFGLAYLAVGVSGAGWTLSEYEITKKKLIEQTNKRDFVVNYIDKDTNGLSFQEDYKIKELMNIQDSSINYVPSQADWNKAYDMIQAKEAAKNLALDSNDVEVVKGILSGY